ncbi:aldehyde dehydrogenase family protein [Clostridia bacterium OttesenSCG-928-F22]|nr:aldehyde dehydrogenase family protein [Clostridia bacterium OttesenSCG-928-F22]
MDALQYVQEMIEKSRVAQKEFEQYTQEQVDACVRAIGMAIYDNAVELAEMAVEETRMGVVEHKINKNRRKALSTWNRLKNVKSVGVINYIDDKGLVEVAKPLGVVGAVTPTTNPIITPNNNAMLALKGRNSMVICPHPRAKKCGKRAVEYMNAALDKLGAPKNLIQIVEEPTVEISNLIMQNVDVCISTGGPGMVKAVYSSGKPAFGVGAGNVQCLIQRNADFAKAAKTTIDGRAFDNGILCTCEQCAHVPSDKFDEVIAAFEKEGAYYISDAAEIAKLREHTFPEGQLNRDCVGLSAQEVAKNAGVSIPKDARAIMVLLDKAGESEALCREKMFPILGVLKYDKWEEAVANAVTNLNMEGQGHSSVIHGSDKADIEYAAERIPVSRIVINQMGSTALGGAFNNGLEPTATLGCGSWGNNSISENLNYKHMLNISRVAYEIPNTVVPSDEEIWG